MELSKNGDGGIWVFDEVELPDEWAFDQLGNCCTIRRGASPRPAGHPRYFGGGTIPWIKIGDATKSGGRYIESTEEHVNEDGAKCSVHIPAGSLIIANSGASLGFAAITCVPGCIHDGWLLATEFRKLDRDYLFYCINIATQRIRQLADGTTQPNLNTGIARRLVLPFPPLAEQKAIAAVLGALDDKIELNRRMNATLEAVAQALFQSWFVDFAPVRAKLDGRKPAGLDTTTAALFPAYFQESPLGHIPQGWRVVALHELTSYLSRGIGPAYIDAGGVFVLNQKCVRDHRVDFSKARQHDPVKKAIDGRTLQLFDILVNSTGVGTLGRVAQVMHLPGKAIVDSHLTVIRAASEVDGCFLGVALTLRESDIEGLGEGSTGQTELSRARLGGLLFVAPPTQLQKAFGLTVQPLLNRIAENDCQSRTLATLRDALLPKLLSGDIRVANVEEEIACV